MVEGGRLGGAGRVVEGEGVEASGSMCWRRVASSGRKPLREKPAGMC